MSRLRRAAPRTLAALCAVAVAAPTVAVGATATKPTTKPHSILASRLLWATVDVCSPADQRNTIGVRGSMPGNGVTGEEMFMRFTIQYRDASTGKWLALSGNADSGYIDVGSARYRARQAGRSFVFEPAAHQPAYRLRGYVYFQWRRGGKVVISAARPTQLGHRSAAGADPPSYSASTCIIP